MDVATTSWTISRNPHLCPNIKISWGQPPVQSVVRSMREKRWAWEGEASDSTLVDTGLRLCWLVPSWRCAEHLQDPASPGFSCALSRRFVSCSPNIRLSDISLSSLRTFRVFRALKAISVVSGKLHFQHWFFVGANILLYLKFLQTSFKPKTNSVFTFYLIVQQICIVHALC